MKIILRQMQLTNFKGIKSLEVNFNEHVQSVFGQNGIGKSTLFNAFLWCLFGKDMENRTDYQIKTTDENGKEIPKLDHQVKLVLDVDGTETILSRLMRDKWTTPRGTAIERFDGNVTEYFWNDVPMREKDYQAKVNGIIKEDTFKLLTNPLFFNDGLTGYKIPDWQARRNVLMELAGPISDKEIAAGNPRFEGLLKAMAGKSMKEFRDELSARKKKLKEALDMVPARIDEATRAIPEAFDFDAINRQILAKEKEISDLDQALTNTADAQKEKNRQQLEKQQEVFALKNKMQGIEAEIRAESLIAKTDRENVIRILRAELRSLESELSSRQIEQRRIEGEKAKLDERMSNLRAQWTAVNSKQPDPQKDDLKCPSCQQDLPADKIAEKNKVYTDYVTTFNSNKAKRCQEISAEGVELKTKADQLAISIAAGITLLQEKSSQIDILKQTIADKEAESLRLNQAAEQSIADAISTDQGIRDSRAKVEIIEAEIKALQSDATDTTPIKTQKQIMTAELDALKKQLNTREQIERGNKRVEELNAEQRQLSQQLADVEGIEFTCQEFVKSKIGIVESRINGKFKYATFKLFHTQVDGTEIECCETMRDGVVFGSLNTAGRIQVGLDIINVLSEHYGVRAPIFIDNRESVHSIPDIDSQIINLIMSPDDKQLRVA